MFTPAGSQLDFAMLTLLPTLKARLAILPTDTQHDDLLMAVIRGITARFDRECRRTLARTVDYAQEFPIARLHIAARCYPVETVSRFEIKESEAAGWVEQTGVEHLVRSSCLISLEVPLWYGRSGAGNRPAAARVIYTGGYVLPGTTPAPGQTALPEDLERAAIEQAVFWFQTRDIVGVVRQWPRDGSYVQFTDLDLLPSVRSTLNHHRRW
jgi:hypothetical protein